MARRMIEGGGSEEELAKRFAERMREDARRSLNEREARWAELAAPFDQLWQGLSRYWQKKRESQVR
jgi:hypothetical protein